MFDLRDCFDLVAQKTMKNNSNNSHAQDTTAL